MKEEDKTREERRIEKNDVVSNNNIALLQKISLEAIGSINKILFVLSTGTFALTISLIVYLDTEIYEPFLLVGAWHLLLVSIIGSMVVHFTSAKAAARKIEMINHERETFYKSGWNQSGYNKDRKAMFWLNVGQNISYFVVIPTLLVALYLTASFASINLLSKAAANEVKKRQDDTSRAVDLELRKMMYQSLKSK